jgi:hypothetical protein
MQPGTLPRCENWQGPWLLVLGRERPGQPWSDSSGLRTGTAASVLQTYSLALQQLLDLVKE